MVPNQLKAPQIPPTTSSPRLTSLKQWKPPPTWTLVPTRPKNTRLRHTQTSHQPPSLFNPYNKTYPNENPQVSSNYNSTINLVKSRSNNLQFPSFLIDNVTSIAISNGIIHHAENYKFQPVPPNSKNPTSKQPRILQTQRIGWSPPESVTWGIPTDKSTHKVKQQLEHLKFEVQLIERFGSIEKPMPIYFSPVLTPKKFNKQMNCSTSK